MKQALKWAAKAETLGEVPIGAVLVSKDGEVLSYGYNRRETWNTVLGHAELLALHRASKKLGAWRLIDTTLYVTLEPCAMCAGALVQARVGRIVYGARDPKAGAVHSLYEICNDQRLNHQIPITSGVLEEECGDVLRAFFKRRRAENKAAKA